MYQWELLPMTCLLATEGMAITSSRVMIPIFYGVPNQPGYCVFWKILVWDRKTGDLVRWYGLPNYYAPLTLSQVLDLSSADWGDLVILNAQIIFLDEFRMAIIPCELTAAGLLIFDTQVSQGDPGYFRRLEFPMDLHHRPIYVHVDHDRNLGAPNTKGALVPDPSQTVLVMELGDTLEPRDLLVVRTKVLIRQAFSAYIDSRVPWGEWSRDAVTIEVQMYGCALFTFVHGAQVMAVQEMWNRMGEHCHQVRTFDFGRRSALPARRGAGITKRRLLFEDGARSEFESGRGLNLWTELQSLSDGSLFYLVGRPFSFPWKWHRLTPW